MKPIEPGCLAIVVGDRDNNGVCVVVGQNLGLKTQIEILGEIEIACSANGSPIWEVSPEIKIGTYVDSGLDAMAPICTEARLLRIDGYEETEEEKQEVTA